MNLLLCCARASKGNVLQDGGLEQCGLLAHKANLGAGGSETHRSTTKNGEILKYNSAMAAKETANTADLPVQHYLQKQMWWGQYHAVGLASNMHG